MNLLQYVRKTLLAQKYKLFDQHAGELIAKGGDIGLPLKNDGTTWTEKDDKALLKAVSGPMGFETEDFNGLLSKETIMDRVLAICEHIKEQG